MLYLWNRLTPQVEREGRLSAAEDNNTMILPRLNLLLSHVLPVVAGWHQVVGHFDGSDLNFVHYRNLVVKDLVDGDNALCRHAG